jgi:predicted heme/steroid binding protein/uncharacterized membrane protein
MKSFGDDELREGTGRDGNPALVAVDGKVYEVTASRRWKNGRHMNSHSAGRDLSAEMETAPHGMEVFDKVELVGELRGPEDGKAAGGRAPAPPALIASVLSLHPHPVSAHFPIALAVAAGLFTVVGVVFENESFRMAALYNLCFAAAAVPVSMVTGLMSQRYNYAGKWTTILRWKFGLSLVIATLMVAAVAIRLTMPESAIPGRPLYWVYSLIVVGLVPIVTSVGYLGGRITFPR